MMRDQSANGQVTVAPSSPIEFRLSYNMAGVIQQVRKRVRESIVQRTKRHRAADTGEDLMT